MAKKRQKRKQNTPADQITPGHLGPYEITDEPIFDEAYKRLPQNVKERLGQLHAFTLRRPKAAIPELLALHEKYPKIQQFANYLVVAYNRTGQKELARQLIVANYRRTPEYLFARVQYAELCLREGNYAEVPQIFAHKFDLKVLYPERRRFHVSEVVAFFSMLANYFLVTGNRERAEQIYQMLCQLQPKHMATRALKRKLYPSLLRRLIIRLTGKKEDQS